LAQEEHPEPPFDPVNFPPLLDPKTENFLSTLRLRHFGQDTAAAPPLTSFSNSARHFAQRNS